MADVIGAERPILITNSYLSQENEAQVLCDQRMVINRTGERLRVNEETILYRGNGTGSPSMSTSTLKRTKTTYIAAAKNKLNINGDSAQPCRSPCVTSNHSECTPSSVRTQAQTSSSSWRITAGIFADTPKCVSTFRGSPRSTESYAF